MRPSVFGVMVGAMIGAAPLAALGQQAGHYQGTDADGGEVDVYVSSSGGGFELTGFDESVTVTCKGQSYGWGVASGGSLATITDGQASFTLAYSTVYQSASLTFSGKNKVSGKTQVVVPVLNEGSAPPRQAYACGSKNEKFTASYVGTETRSGGTPAIHAQQIGR